MRSGQAIGVDQGATRATFLSVGEFFLDHEMLRAWLNGRLLKVTMRQYRLIELFMVSAGQPVTREQIMKKVWGRIPRSPSDLRAVDAEIIRLRRALGQSADDGPICTVRGVGFIFMPRALCVAGRTPQARPSECCLDAVAG